MKHEGMTLVELLVAMTIGLGITLAISSVLIASENHKRTTTSTNDAQQSGSYAFYALDKTLRSAGSAISESAFPTDVGVLGCHINAAGILPAAAFPAPFAGFLGGAAGTLKVAPVLIDKGHSLGGSDIIMVMSGSGSAGGVSRQITGGGSTNTVILDNSVGFAANDLLLVSQSGVPDCLVEQVSAVTIPPSPTVPLAGVYYTPTASSGTTMATLASSTSTYVTPLGNATANNVQFMLYGVDNNRTLYSYDLLQNLHLVGAAPDAAQAVADGIVQMSALYGIDINGDGIQDQWADPGDAGNWDINTVMNSPTKMKQIVSVRVALVVRGENYDLNGGTAALPNPITTSYTYFNNLRSGPCCAGTSLTQTVNLFGADQQFRYRVFEFTVPLRNMLLLAGG